MRSVGISFSFSINKGRYFGGVGRIRPKRVAGNWARWRDGEHLKNREIVRERPKSQLLSTK